MTKEAPSFVLPEELMQERGIIREEVSRGAKDLAGLFSVYTQGIKKGAWWIDLEADWNRQAQKYLPVGGIRHSFRDVFWMVRSFDRAILHNPKFADFLLEESTEYIYEAFGTKDLKPESSILLSYIHWNRSRHRRSFVGSSNSFRALQARQMSTYLGVRSFDGLIDRQKAQSLTPQTIFEAIINDQLYIHKPYHELSPLGTDSTRIIEPEYGEFVQ